MNIPEDRWVDPWQLDLISRANGLASQMQELHESSDSTTSLKSQAYNNLMTEYKLVLLKLSEVSPDVVADLLNRAKQEQEKLALRIKLLFDTGEDLGPMIRRHIRLMDLLAS